MRRAFLVVLGLLPATALAETSADEAALFDRLNVREQILDSQKAAAEGSARERSLFAYRLCRRQELGFAPSPETRLDYARAFGMALVALRRSVDEAQPAAECVPSKSEKQLADEFVHKGGRGNLDPAEIQMHNLSLVGDDA